MDKKEHVAPEGYLYFKDGIGTRVVITLSDSEHDLIETYELKKIKNEKGE